MAFIQNKAGVTLQVELCLPEIVVDIYVADGEEKRFQIQKNDFPTTRP
jgi:hypothetical protein